MVASVGLIFRVSAHPSLSISLSCPPFPRLAIPPSPRMNATAATPPPMPPSIKTLRVVIKGRVQGVFFRDWTVQTARELGLNGWVRNRRDGSVEAVFSGEPTAVDEMVERRCRVGPPAAVVTALNSFSSDDDPGQGFKRKPTA